MTSVAVFNMGTASAQPAFYSYAVRHGDHPLDISRTLPPLGPWINDFGGPASWGRRPHSGTQGRSQWHEDSRLPQVGNSDGQDGQHDLGAPRDEDREPHQDDGGAGQQREVFPAAPIEWLAAPPPLAVSTPWLGGDRGEGGVATVLPWLLTMSLISTGQGAPGLQNNRQNNRPGGARRPGPARPGQRTNVRTSAPANASASASASAPAPAPASRSTTTENGRLHELYKWKQIDYEFPSAQARAQAVAMGDYIPENNLPLGVEAYKDRVFVSIPRWKPGVPATLAYVPRYPNGDSSPLLKPYPDWSWHRVPRRGQNDSCQALTSVFRMAADECGRLWVIDSGAVDAIGDIQVFCPPQIVIFDLNTDKLIWRYIIPQNQVKAESLFTNIIIDIRDGNCDDAYAYASDVFRYGLLVYSWREDRSYRLNHNLFFPDPIASRYVLDDVVFRWTDGVFGLALSPVQEDGDRTLYFHPMSSFKEFAVQTSLIRNETIANANPDEFRVLGQRGLNQSHSSASAMDRRGVLFFNLVTQDALGCWDSSKPYRRPNVAHVSQDHALLNFPNDLKVDQEEPQSIWLLSNRLHLYLYKTLDPNEYNYRILTGSVNEATEGTICDPEKTAPATTVPEGNDACEL